MKLVAEVESGRLLGAQVLAEAAGEVIQTAALAIRARMTGGGGGCLPQLEQLADLLEGEAELLGPSHETEAAHDVAFELPVSSERHGGRPSLAGGRRSLSNRSSAVRASHSSVLQPGEIEGWPKAPPTQETPAPYLLESK